MNKSLKPEAAASGDAPARPPEVDSAPVKSTWLTSQPSEFGPTGWFVDLTDEQHADADKAFPGLLVKPTAEQLALRV